MATFFYSVVLWIFLSYQAQAELSRHFQHFLGRIPLPSTRKGSYGSYKELYYEQKLDHFNVGDTRTYQERYLVNDDYWNKYSPNPGPILLYTGNEADITVFYDNTVINSHNCILCWFTFICMLVIS